MHPPDYPARDYANEPLTHTRFLAEEIRRLDDLLSEVIFRMDGIATTLKRTLNNEHAALLQEARAACYEGLTRVHAFTTCLEEDIRRLEED